MVLKISLSYRSCWIIQKSQKCIFEWSKGSKKRFSAIFWTLVRWIDFILLIVILLNSLTIWYCCYSGFAAGSFNNDVTLVQNDMFWPVFYHFLKFGPLGRLHIAYFDCAKWSSRFVNSITRVLHLNHSIITLLWFKRICFDQFLVIFSSLVLWIDFILHISIQVSGLRDLVSFQDGAYLLQGDSKQLKLSPVLPARFSWA